MQTNASFVRISLFAVAALVAAACAGPAAGPSKQVPGTGGNGGSTGTGSGGSTGTGSGGTGGSGGGGGTATGGDTPDGGTTPGSDGGITTASLGCAGYVACLENAMSDADAMACDQKATANATTLLNAAEDCVGNYCLGMSGAAARCKQSATDGSMQNLDGTAAFDMNGAPTGDCGACLLNGDAGMWGEACMPTTDAACNTSACAQQTAACTADK